MNTWYRICTYVTGASFVGIGIHLFTDPILFVKRLSSRIDFGEYSVIAGLVFIACGLWMIIAQYKQPKMNQ